MTHVVAHLETSGQWNSA